MINNNFMTQLSELMKNPKEYAMKNFGVSEDIAGDPNKIIQNLMSNGKITQEQYNSARATAMQMQNNPMFRQFFK